MHTLAWRAEFVVRIVFAIAAVRAALAVNRAVPWLYRTHAPMWLIAPVNALADMAYGWGVRAARWAQDWAMG
jgi:hypothetical protein